MATATDSMTDAPSVTVHSTGLFMVGGLLGYKDLPPRESNGRKFENTEVGLLVGGEVIAVQFQGHEAAVKATGDAPRGDVIALRVDSMNGIDRNGRSYLFYVGFRGGSLDASEFGF